LSVIDVIERRFPRSIENDSGEERKIYWPEEADTLVVPIFRSAPRGERDHSDIPLVELAGLARHFIDDGADHEEAVRRMAAAFELNRLRASTRARFEAAVRLASGR
jgi:hypothetical protein